MFSSTHGSQCDSDFSECNYIPGYIIEDESNYTSHEIGTLEAVLYKVTSLKVTSYK